MKDMTQTLPAWQFMQPKAIPSGTGPALWSNANPPPAVGDVVTVRINGIGAGCVLGYQVHEGYLGVWVTHDSPPEWYLKQNGNVPGFSFGAELRY